MTHAHEKYHHGRSPAAWVGSIVSLIGFVVSSAGFLMNLNWLVIWVGFALVLLGAVAGGVMRKMGYGQE
jgi:hypothetical protein